MYGFEIYFDGPAAIVELEDDVQCDRIYDAIRHDGTLARSQGRTHVAFDRDARSFELAVMQAALELMTIPEITLTGLVSDDPTNKTTLQEAILKAEEQLSASVSA